MSNEETITEETKLAVPLKAWVVIIVSICSVALTVAIAYTNLKATDDTLAKGLEKNEKELSEKVDKKEFDKQKFIDSIRSTETNRKLGLIMEHLRIPDYGQEPKK